MGNPDRRGTIFYTRLGGEQRATEAGYHILIDADLQPLVRLNYSDGEDRDNEEVLYAWRHPNWPNENWPDERAKDKSRPNSEFHDR